MLWAVYRLLSASLRTFSRLWDWTPVLDVLKLFSSDSSSNSNSNSTHNAAAVGEIKWLCGKILALSLGTSDKLTREIIDRLVLWCSGCSVCVCVCVCVVVCSVCALCVHVFLCV